MSYRAAVIGCGGIGGFLDAPGDAKVLTHAHAYRSARDFSLTACCDIRPEAVRRFQGRWGRGIRGYTDPGELLEKEPLDVLSICADTASHASILEAALYKPGLRVIVCEKPLVATQGEFRRVSRALAAHPEKRVMMNFIRRYDPAFAVLAARLKRGDLGSPLRFSALFNKGLYHNGCHALELAERLFGPVRAIRAGSCRVRGGDLFGDFHVETRRCKGLLCAPPGLRCSLFEFDILLSGGRVRISEGGLRIEASRVRGSARYAGYREMVLERTWGGGLLSCGTHLLRHVRAHLRGRPLDPGASAAHWALSRRLLLARDALLAGRKEVDLHG